MNIVRSVLAVCAAAICLLWPLRASAEPLPPNVERVGQHGPVTEYRLKSNGMSILLVPRDAAPVVTFMVVYHIGSRNEGPGNTGSAHLLEHMLFNKSTAHFGKASGQPTIQMALHEVGVDFASTNMTTWKDRMNGYSTVPSDRLELAMRIEADRLRTARILDAERQPEMSVVRNEYEISENAPGDVLEKAVVAAAIVAHPYHWDTLGYRSDIEGVSTEQLRDHYRRFFWADNAAAILVGDFQTAAALPMFDRYFGAMPRSPQPIPQVVTVEPPQEGERRVTVSRPGNVGRVEFAYPRPGVLDPDWYALDVLTNIVGTGRNARLYRALVDAGLAQDVGVGNDALHDPYLIEPWAELSPDATHASVEAAMRKVVQGVRDGGVTPVEVARAVRGIEVSLASSRDGVFDMTNALGEAVASANWRWWVDYLDNVRQVTAADVQRVARKYMVDEHLTVGWFVPKKEAARKVGVSSSAPRPKRKVSPRIAAAAVAAPAASAPRTGFVARTVRRVWPHRLILDVLPNHAAPTVAIQGLLRAGSVLAPRAQPELAAVTAEMLSRGTATRTQLQVSQTLEDLGATLAWQSGTYDASVQGYCLSRDLPVVLDLLADEMLHPSFPADELEKVKLQRKGQLLSNAENTASRAAEALYDIAFPASHPLHVMPVLERANTVEHVRAADVRDFYRKCYHGGNLVLTIVGDVDADAVTKLVEQRFGALPEGDAPAVDVPRVAPVASQQRVITMKGKANVDLLVGTSGGLRRGDPDYYACLLANAVFGQDSLSSRVGRRVRDTEGLSYHLYSRFFGADLLEGVWGVDVAVAPQNLGKALASTREVLADFMRANVTEAELAAQKGFFAGNFQVHLATNAGIAASLAEAEKFGFGPAYLDAFPQRIREVTLAQVNEAIRRHFDPEKISVVVAGDVERIP